MDPIEVLADLIVLGGVLAVLLLTGAALVAAMALVFGLPL